MISAMLTWKAFVVFVVLGIVLSQAATTIAGIFFLLAIGNLVAHIFHFGGNAAKAVDKIANQ